MILPLHGRLGPLGYRTRPLAAAAGDPLWSQVKLLTHMDDSGFADVSSSPASLTTTAALDTTNKKFGAGSASHANNNEILTFSNAGGKFTLTNEDWTFEIWVRGPFRAASRQLVNSSFVRLSSNNLSLTATVSFNNFTGQSTVGSAMTLTSGVWHHIAVTRSGSSFRVFIDGVQSGSTLTNANPHTGSNNFVIGGVAGSGNSAQGNTDEARLTVGTGRYTSDFTPPTAALPDS